MTVRAFLAVAALFIFGFAAGCGDDAGSDPPPGAGFTGTTPERYAACLDSVGVTVATSAEQLEFALPNGEPDDGRESDSVGEMAEGYVGAAVSKKGAYRLYTAFPSGGEYNAVTALAAPTADQVVVGFLRPDDADKARAAEKCFDVGGSGADAPSESAEQPPAPPTSRPESDDEEEPSAPDDGGTSVAQYAERYTSCLTAAGVTIATSADEVAFFKDNPITAPGVDGDISLVVDDFRTVTLHKPGTFRLYTAFRESDPDTGVIKVLDMLSDPEVVVGYLRPDDRAKAAKADECSNSVLHEGTDIEALLESSDP